MFPACFTPSPHSLTGDTSDASVASDTCDAESENRVFNPGQLRMTQVTTMTAMSAMTSMTTMTHFSKNESGRQGLR